MLVLCVEYIVLRIAPINVLIRNACPSDLDEGEGESGDASVPPPVVAPPMLQHPRPPVVTQTPNQQLTSTRPNTVHHSSSQPRERHSSFLNVTNAAHTSTSASAPPRALEASGGGGVVAGNSRQRTLDMYPKLPRPETTRLMPSNNSNRPAAMAQQQLPTIPTAAQNKKKTNPYQRPNDSNISEASDAQQGSRENRQHLPPLPLQNETNVIPIDDSPPPTVTHRKSEEPPLSNPYASLRPSPNTISSNSTASTTFTSNPSFGELKSILALLRSDRDMYEQYYDKIITVPCKLDNSANANAVFNIVKSPKHKWKSKKEKEYEFYVVGKFYGPKQSDGAIACRVESSLIDPYFGIYTPVSSMVLNVCSTLFIIYILTLFISTNQHFHYSGGASKTNS
jgi:hypothetical protein